jgi:hypothetical protein
MILHEEYVIDEKGNRKAVLLPYNDWQIIMAELEELEDIRAYDNARKKPSEPIPFDEAIKGIRKRKMI